MAALAIKRLRCSDLKPRLTAKWAVVHVCFVTACQEPMLNVEDVLAEQRQIRLTAHVEQRAFLFTEPIPNVAVTFLRGEERLGTAQTDSRGRATLTVPWPQDYTSYSAVARVASRAIGDHGHVFLWERNRPLIAIDLDETMVRSQYVGLFLQEDDPSLPHPDSRQIVTMLSERYGIIYVSARGRLLRAKTKRWLDRHGYPVGPLVLADDISYVFKQSECKRRLLADLRATWPNLQIGIGDKFADEHGFIENDMLSIIINPWYVASATETHVLQNWRDVGQLFERGEFDAISQTLSTGPPAPIGEGLSQGQHVAIPTSVAPMRSGS